jgi:hypothetical protein
MSLVKLSFPALLAAVALPFVFVSPTLAADAKQVPKPAVVKPPVPTGAELVGKLLAEQSGPSDPDVPMPQRGLSRVPEQPASSPLSGPQVFGRQEEGGGVFGLKIPIPANRGAF